MEIDDATIEDVHEDYILDDNSGSYSNFISGLLNYVIGSVERYGWFILIGGCLVYYLYNKYKHDARRQPPPPQRSFSSNYQRTNVNESTSTASAQVTRQDAEKKKNDDVVAQQSATALSIAEARRRQQEAIDAAAAKFLDEKKKKDEEKLQERIEDYDRLQEGLSYRSKLKNRQTDDDKNEQPAPKSDSKSKPKLRSSDYNPLTGSGGGGDSCRFKPSKRGGASGG